MSKLIWVGCPRHNRHDDACYLCVTARDIRLRLAAEEQQRQAAAEQAASQPWALPPAGHDVWVNRFWDQSQIDYKRWEF